jgi:hypothetical protein
MPLLNKPKAPALILPRAEYSAENFNQHNNTLRLYFNQLDAVFAALLGNHGTSFLSSPYGAFQDTTTQTALANTATVMTLDTVDFQNGVSIVSGSRITVAHSGLYNLQWSAQFENADSQIHDAYVWLRQDGAGAGVDIPGSTGRVSIPSSHGGVHGALVTGWNYFVQLEAGEFVELWWAPTSTQVTIPFVAAGTAPVRPSTASLIVTMSFVSSL